MGSCTSSASVQNSVNKKPKEEKLEATPSKQQNLVHKSLNSNSKANTDGKSLYSENEPGVDAKKGAGADRNQAKKYKFLEVGAQDDMIFENLTKVERELTPDVEAFLVNSLEKHSFFSNLSTSDKKKMVSKMFPAITKKDDFVFQQNDKATCFFVIEKGQTSVFISEVKKKVLKSGDNFGELALLYNAPRSASIKADEQTTFWVLERKAFKQVVEEVSRSQFKENREFLGKIRFFEAMTDGQKDSIARSLIFQKFKTGDPIISEGDQASSYYIIKAGTADCIKEGKSVRKLVAGDSFGEQALYESGVRSLTVKAAEECSCLSLSRDALQESLGAKIQEVIQGNWARWAIEKNPTLSKLTKLQIEKCILNSTPKKFSAGEKIQDKNSSITEVVIVIEGDLKFGAQDFPKGSVFSDKHLYPTAKLKVKLGSDLVAASESHVLVLPVDLFHKLIGGFVEDVLVKNLKSHEAKMKDDDRTNIKKKFENMKISDLLFIKKLGEGQFGHVFLVKHRTENELYALKGISKHQIAEQKLEKHTKQEKDVLENINFPFLMTMYRTFKDDNFVYFLLGFIQGMELFDVIRKMDLLDNDESRFYIGSILLGIEYLHSKNIIYRDLKPENVMVDKKGYLRIVDMGTAKILKAEDGMKTFTILGTPHYMAPEILTNKGYGLNADLWSIGIVLYEFMCGKVPFGEECEDPYEVYTLVQKQKLAYPGYFQTPENKYAQKFMEQLLSRNPEARKNGSNFASIKANKWFDHFDWDKLVDFKLHSPYIPPDDLVISDSEIHKISKQNTPITQEIEKSAGKFKGNKANLGKKDWDKHF